jgi:polysaccharide export outer membrane protein
LARSFEEQQGAPMKKPPNLRKLLVASAAPLLMPALLMPIAGCASSNLAELSVGEANRQVDDGYAVAVGDRLKVTVFDEPNLTGEYVIGASGELTLPLIDPIPASGQAPNKIAAAITAQLKAGAYILNPRVAVEIMKFRPIYVLGEVGRPGEYPYDGKLTYLQAVAKAGGFTPRANHKVVELQRQGWPSGRMIKLTEAPLVVAPGDTLVVREAFF